jgi:hypothetical protein
MINTGRAGVSSDRIKDALVLDMVFSDGHRFSRSGSSIFREAWGYGSYYLWMHINPSLHISINMELFSKLFYKKC